ncbi:MAG: DNA methyltransferase [bacterium]
MARRRRAGPPRPPGGPLRSRPLPLAGRPPGRRRHPRRHPERPRPRARHRRWHRPRRPPGPHHRRGPAPLVQSPRRRADRQRLRAPHGLQRPARARPRPLPAPHPRLDHRRGAHRPAPARRSAWLQDEAGLGRTQAGKLADALKPARDAAAALDVIAQATGARDRAPAGRLVLQPGAERRRTSSHYTPRSLSAPIVARTLEPLLACMGPAPSAAQLLELKICDPAMGSGAFLVEACRHLADHVVAAWTRDGTAEQLAARVPDLATHARRLVAQRCLYGVDKNPFAVELARMSLWLVTLARDLPFTFVDHALRHGDSLVGLSLDQIRAFHWAPTAQQDLFAAHIRQTLDDTIDLRQQILDLADAADTRAKARLLDDATTFTRRARDLADLCLGAFFSEARPAAREKERLRRLALAEAWLRDDDVDAEAEVRRLAAEFRHEVPAFHWMLELPEVFYAERPDPLAGGKPGVAWMDAFVGNPPFAGKNGISDAGGPHYIDWLKTVHEGAHGNADLSAHFFRRAADLLGPHGTLGLIATNTIGQGDTRATALAPLIARGGTIYDATDSLPWPGEAAVTVSVAHVAIGEPRTTPGPTASAAGWCPPSTPGCGASRSARRPSRWRPTAARPTRARSCWAWASR